jgi:hypothetical protein
MKQELIHMYCSLQYRHLINFSWYFNKLKVKYLDYQKVSIRRLQSSLILGYKYKNKGKFA